MKYVYQTHNVCPKKIEFNIEGDIIKNVTFLEGGCPGNLQALPRLVEGMSVFEISKKLKGIDCAGKKTSCADQLAKAVVEAYEEQLQKV